MGDAAGEALLDKIGEPGHLPKYLLHPLDVLRRLENQAHRPLLPFVSDRPGDITTT